MSEPNIKTFLGNLLLTAAAGWGMVECCSEYPYACVGFALYAVKGTLGMLAFFVEDDTLKSIHEEDSYIVNALGLPLFATQVMMSGGQRLELSLLNLVVPLADIVARDGLNKEMDPNILQVSHVLSLIALCYFGYVSGQVIAAPLATLLFLVDEFGKEKYEDDVHTLIIVLAILSQWALLKKKLE